MFGMKSKKRTDNKPTSFAAQIGMTEKEYAEAVRPTVHIWVDSDKVTDAIKRVMKEQKPDKRSLAIGYLMGRKIADNDRSCGKDC